MRRYLMCRHGAAKILSAAPESGAYFDTVTVRADERYQVLRDGKTLCAVQINWG